MNTTPKSHYSHAKIRAGKDAVDVLAEHGVTVLPPGGRRRLVESGAPAVWVESMLDVLADELRYIGARVERADRAPDGPCEWCSTEGRVAEVVLYPGEGTEEMCRDCAPTRVASAISSNQHRRPVRVEICEAP